MFFFNLRKMRIWLLLPFIILFITSSAIAKSEPLRIAVDAPYPPFAYYDEKNNLTGFDVDFANALCVELKRECEIVLISFDLIIPSIVDGKIDLGVAGMSSTEERRKLIDFTDRYFRSHSIFIGKPGNVEISDKGLKDKVIATYPGTIQEAYLRKMYGDIATIVTENDHEKLYGDLKSGKINVVFVDGLPGYYYLKSPEGEGLEAIGEPIHSDLVVDSSCIAVSKNNPQLRKDVNEAIQKLRHNGQYDKINRKYFDFNIY